MHACMAMQCLHSSEKVAVIILDMQLLLTVYISPRFCIVVLQDVLKKLANVPKNRELLSGKLTCIGGSRVIHRVPVNPPSSNSLI